MATHEMTDDQEAHLKFIKYKFSKIMEPKFRKGAEEHATLLHEQPKELLLDYAIEEAIDQVVYLLTLKYGSEFEGLISDDNSVTTDDDRHSERSRSLD